MKRIDLATGDIELTFTPKDTEYPMLLKHAPETTEPLMGYFFDFYLSMMKVPDKDEIRICYSDLEDIEIFLAILGEEGAVCGGFCGSCG